MLFSVRNDAAKDPQEYFPEMTEDVSRLYSNRAEGSQKDRKRHRQSDKLRRSMNASTSEY